jgi:alcohol dehydrogenase class IV
MQVEFFGKNSLKNLKKIISDLGAKKILLVTGKDSFKKSGAEEKLIEYLGDAIIERFFNFEPNPNIKDVQVGINIISTFKPDLVIAIGGGSVIDIAKLINIFAAHVTKEKEIYDFVNKSSDVQKSGATLIAIPTTSGTGSEATHFAVVYIGTKKYSFAHEYVLPDFSIIDPSLTYSNPNYVKACSGLDALSQAIESFWAVGSNEESKNYSRQAIEIILSSIEMAVIEDNEKSMDRMSVAANLAGKAINISKTTAPHALSYPITKFLDIPHGHAVALTLGKFISINSNFHENKLIDKRGVRYLSDTMEELFKLFGKSNAAECELMWYQLMSNIGLETNLSKLLIENRFSIKSIINGVNIERLTNNPVEINEDAIYCLLNEIS